MATITNTQRAIWPLRTDRAMAQETIFVGDYLAVRRGAECLLAERCRDGGPLPNAEAITDALPGETVTLAVFGPILLAEQVDIPALRSDEV